MNWDGVFGSPTWTRTRDLRINSPSLYRLSYQGMEGRILGAARALVKLTIAFHSQLGDVIERYAHRRCPDAVMRAAKVERVGAIALVDLVEHDIEALVLVLRFE